MQRFFRGSARCWPGVIFLAILWALAAWSTTEPLEAGLAAQSAAALNNIVLEKSQIEFDGRDVTVAANAFSEPERLKAAAAVAAVPGVRLVNDDTRLVAEAKPFVWTAERDVVRVTLGGSAPLPATKNKLLEAAGGALGGGEVAGANDQASGVAG